MKTASKSARSTLTAPRSARLAAALATLLALAAASATSQLAAQDAGGKGGNAPVVSSTDPAGASDPIETDSPEAKKLADKLHVAPNWRGKSGTVDLLYPFGLKKTEHLDDFKFSGLDKAEFEGPKKKEPNPTTGLDLAASSNGAGTAILDAVECLGDFSLEATLKVSFMGPSSDLVFLVGIHGTDALGLRYGQQFVKVKKGGVSNLSHNQVVLDKFAMSRTVTVKIVRKGDDLSSSIDGSEVAKKTFTYKDLDGKVGFLLSSNVHIRINKLELKGSIAMPK